VTPQEACTGAVDPWREEPTLQQVYWLSIQQNSVKYTAYDILFAPCPSEDVTKATVMLLQSG